MSNDREVDGPDEFAVLVAFLRRVPAVEDSISYGRDDGWWVKLSLDVDHPLAWHIVQEFGHVLNYLSVEEQLPTVFKPVSPPPYMNGGPQDFLSWVIEGLSADFSPDQCAEWLEGRLPRPVDDLSQWDQNDD
jgi:hypothetical protein